MTWMERKKTANYYSSDFLCAKHKNKVFGVRNYQPKIDDFSFHLKFWLLKIVHNFVDLPVQAENMLKFPTK